MSEQNDEFRDPIMEEVRRNREALSARFGGDVRKLVAYLNEQAAKGGRRIAATQPRPPQASAAPPAA